MMWNAHLSRMSPSLIQLSTRPSPNGVFHIAARLTGRQQEVGSVDLLLGDGKSVELVNLAVNQDHRRQGIGARLVQAALENVHSRGYTQIRLKALPNGPGIGKSALVNMYRGFGFRTEGIARDGGTLMARGRSAEPIVSGSKPTAVITAKLASGVKFAPVPNVLTHSPHGGPAGSGFSTKAGRTQTFLNRAVQPRLIARNPSLAGKRLGTLGGSASIQRHVALPSGAVIQRAQMPAVLTRDDHDTRLNDLGDTIVLSETLEMDYGDIPGMDRFREDVRSIPLDSPNFYPLLQGYNYQLAQIATLHQQERVQEVEYAYQGRLALRRADILTTSGRFIDAKAYAANSNPPDEEKRRFFLQAFDYAHSGHVVHYIFSNGAPAWAENILHAINHWDHTNLLISGVTPVFQGNRNTDPLVALMRLWYAQAVGHSPGAL